MGDRGKIWQSGPGSLQIKQPGDVHRLVSRPPSGEIVAQRAKALRWAEKTGEYEQLFSARNAG